MPRPTPQVLHTAACGPLLTSADGRGQSIHELRERLAGGRGAAAQQMDVPGVLAELLQVPRQQVELLALRPALLLQLTDLGLRGGGRHRSAGGVGVRTRVWTAYMCAHTCYVKMLLKACGKGR